MLDLEIVIIYSPNCKSKGWVKIGIRFCIHYIIGDLFLCFLNFYCGIFCDLFSSDILKPFDCCLDRSFIDITTNPPAA